MRPLGILIDIAYESSAKRTTTRVDPHLHQLGSRLLVLSKLWRRCHILLQELFDILLSSTLVERSLCLVHQLLHYVGKVALGNITIVFAAKRFTGSGLGIEEICFCYQMAALITLAMERLSGLISTGRPLHDIERADRFVGNGYRHGVELEFFVL